MQTPTTLLCYQCDQPWFIQCYGSPNQARQLPAASICATTGHLSSTIYICVCTCAHVDKAQANISRAMQLANLPFMAHWHLLLQPRRHELLYKQILPAELHVSAGNCLLQSTAFAAQILQNKLTHPESCFDKGDPASGPGQRQPWLL